MSSIQQSRNPHTLDLSLRRDIRKPLWCIGEGKSVSFTTLSRQENEVREYLRNLSVNSDSLTKLQRLVRQILTLVASS